MRVDKKEGKKGLAKPRIKKSKSQDFSDQINGWLDSDQPKTMTRLNEVFGNKTFAILFMFLMGTSALPIPTGGLTDVFAVITVIFAFQMALGKEELWLPKRWRRLKLSQTMTRKLLPGLVKVISWMERFSEPRMDFVFKSRFSNQAIGLSVATLAAATIVAPPFSGLDTLPALGVVIISAGIILKDGLVTIIGGLVGLIGLSIQFFFGKAVVRIFKRFFNL